LKALGEFVVESMNVWRGAADDSVSPDGFLTVQLKLRRRGTPELEDRVILLSVADAAKWAVGFKVSAGWQRAGWQRVSKRSGEVSTRGRSQQEVS
jgi:hypothetical protein